MFEKCGRYLEDMFRRFHVFFEEGLIQISEFHPLVSYTSHHQRHIRVCTFKLLGVKIGFNRNEIYGFIPEDPTSGAWEASRKWGYLAKKTSILTVSSQKVKLKDFINNDAVEETRFFLHTLLQSNKLQ